jgi:beta-glucosidase
MRPSSPRRAVEAVYASDHGRTLDVVGFDYYDPVASRHLRAPGHMTAGGRTWAPARELWDDVPDPVGLHTWLAAQHDATPGLPLWVVENGLCNRVRNARSYPRLDGWDRSRYLRENIAAVMAAVDAGLLVSGYWHWSLVDNYEWGSYQPRFGLFGLDRHHGPTGAQWLDTDSMGGDSAGTYRRIIAGLRQGDRSVLVDPT